MLFRKSLGTAQPQLKCFVSTRVLRLKAEGAASPWTPPLRPWLRSGRGYLTGELVIAPPEISRCLNSPSRLYPHLLPLTLYFYSSFLLHLISLIAPVPLLSNYFSRPSCPPGRAPRGPAAAPRREKVPEAESRGRGQLRARPAVTSPMLRPQ